MAEITDVEEAIAAYKRKKKKKYDKKRYQEHKEKILAQKRAYREKNRDRLLARRREYYQEHREKILAQKKANRERRKKRNEALC